MGRDMNTDSETGTDQALPEPLDSLKQSVARLQRQLLITTIVCLFALVGATTALSLLWTADNGATEEETAALQIHVSEAEKELLFLQSQFQELLAQTALNSATVNQLAERVASVDVGDQNNVIVRLQRILIRQERDYRDFLTSLENGLYNFHMMVPHSRGWWTDYREELVRTAELSKARENYVVNLRSN